MKLGPIEILWHHKPRLVGFRDASTICIIKIKGETRSYYTTYKHNELAGKLVSLFWALKELPEFDSVLRKVDGL